jgi:PAP2 superfamily protein
MPPVLRILLAGWFLAIGAQAIRKRDARLWQILAVSVVCVLGVGCVGVALKTAARYTTKYDLWLYTADTALGSPAFGMARLLRPTALFPLLVAVYEAMPMAMLMVYAAHLLRGGTPERVLGAFALNFGAGYCLYLLFPACGPEYAFASFPAARPGLPVLRTLQLLAPPNCMPSLHTSTALLACWFCGRWRWARKAALLNLLLTVLATLATGEHYLVDLVVAAPFSAAVYGVAQRAYGPAAAWLAVVLAWCGALRFGLAWITAAPGAFLCVCALTVLGAWWLSVRLGAAAQRGLVNQMEYNGAVQTPA